MKEFFKQDLQFLPNKRVIHERHFHQLKRLVEFPNGGIDQSIPARFDSIVKTLAPTHQAYYVDQVVYGRIYPEAHKRYRPQEYSGPAVCFVSEMTPELVAGWIPLMKNGLKVHPVPGDHLSMLAAPNLQSLAEQLKAVLSDAHKVATLGPSARKVMPQDRLKQRLVAIYG